MKRLAGILLLLLCGAACTQGAEPPPAPPSVSGSALEATRVAEGWMGRFSRRDPALATLLQANPGWGQLREMSLFEAAQLFEAGGRPGDRIGAARVYLALADFCEALDRLLLASEDAYFASTTESLSAAQRARRLVVWLRTGRTAAVEAELAAGPSEGFAFTWHLVAARLGRAGTAPTPSPGTPDQRVLGQVAAYLWGLPPGATGNTPYDLSLAAFRAGDLTGGVLTLQMLEFSPAAAGPGPELLLYPLLQRAFAGLARGTVSGSSGTAARFLEAQAAEYLGDAAAAATLYRSAADAATDPEGALAALIFSPFTGEQELQELARVLAGDPAGPAPAPLVALAGAASVPEVAAAVAGLATAPALPGSGEAAASLPELYAARRAAGARWAARVLWRLGEDRAAMMALEESHRKSGGYRPDFVNPPGFLADLAHGHQQVGEYATAVAVLFELANEDPSARVAYESLKRLYASRTGGAVPPR